MKTGYNYILVLIFSIAISPFSLFGQNYTQPASAVSLGGKSGATGIYSHFCVVGEPVVKFNISSGTYTGSIGFLPNAGGNLKPVPILPENLIEVFIGEQVTLDGSQSYDPDNDGITFEWLTPEEITITDPTLPVVSFTAPTVNYKRTYEIALVVSDGMLTDTAWATVVVHNPEWVEVNYPQSTICIGLITVDCFAATADYVLGAFVNNECRGITDVFLYEGSAYVSFLIQGDVPNLQITFKLVNKVTDELLYVPENTLAKTNPGGNLGTFLAPFPIAAYHTVDSQIEIPSGWSGISSTIAPVGKNIENMFLPIQSNLTILYDFSGIYYPAGGTNTLGDWQREKGYVIKMKNSSTLDFTGYKPCTNSLSLASNWSIMPVLSTCPVSVQPLFVGKPLVIIKEVAGSGIYWPAFGINSLGNLTPVKAYFVKMSASGTVNFPTCTKTGWNKQEPNKTINITPWNDPVASPTSHVIAIPQELTQKAFNFGDFIGAFTQDGLCCGINRYLGESSGLTAFADDPETNEKDGFTESDLITLKVFKTESKEEFPLAVIWDKSLTDNDGLFHSNGLSAISGLEVTSIGNLQAGDGIVIYPNPAQDKLNIVVPEQTWSKIIIVNIQGQPVYSGELVFPNTKVDISLFSKGVYFVKIVSEKNSRIFKIVKD